MYLVFKQFVPSQVCLKCDGCCRFRDAASCWRPKITDMEKAAVEQDIPREKIFSANSLAAPNIIATIPWSEQNICFFFHTDNHTCGIYPHRPFECRLYPFVVTLFEGKPCLSVHMACPFIQEHRYTSEFGAYLVELKNFFEKKATMRFLTEYLQLNHSYQGFESELEPLFPLDISTES